MKTEPIKLTENIYAVVVPKDAIQYKVETLDADEDYEAMTVLIFDNLDYIQLPLGEYEILGEVTADSISFDCEHYLEKSNLFHNLFKFYPLDEVGQTVGGKNDAFYSLLQSKEIYFVNPIEEPDFFKKYSKKWQEYESKLVEKVVIIKKV